MLCIQITSMMQMLAEKTPCFPRNCLVGVAIFICQIGTGSLFSMLSRGQQLIQDEGDDVSLQCEFYMERFNLFYNPILWRKIQYTESLELNIMGNIKEPFDGKTKFKVSFNPLPPRYMLGLAIKNLTAVDSGNYSCEIRGPASELLGEVIHTIYVRAPVLDVSIYKEKYSGKPWEIENMPSESSISFIEGYAAPIICMVHGGNPPPGVEVRIGQHDVTNLFQVYTYRQSTGPEGFRISQMTTVLYADKFMAGSEDDDMKLHCSTSVPGTHDMMATANVKVYYGPRIKCEATAAYFGDKNVYLSCIIRARPSVSSIFWMLDGNGTVVSEGEVVNEYWIINMVREGGALQTTLYLRQARQESFRVYTLVAENNVAVATQNVHLRQLHRETKPHPHTVESHEQKYHSATTRKANRPSYIFIQNEACVTRPVYLVITVLSLWTITIHPEH